MSKVYDRINRRFLYKALERICIPDEFINLLKNSLSNRTNTVITAVENTEEYHMKNGIDQGEVISPLLWIIYYNPLFEKLNDHKENAYKISFKFNWQRESFFYEEYMCSNAYMDDTAFIAPSKIALTNTLNIADDFNSMTGIIVNPNKSDLIVINLQEKDKSINYGHDSYNIKCKKEEKKMNLLDI